MCSTKTHHCSSLCRCSTFSFPSSASAATVTPVSGFLCRPLDSSAPACAPLLLCESLLCILAKTVCSAAQGAQQGPERDWGINAVAIVMDVQFFSLFLWADVHPRSQQKTHNHKNTSRDFAARPLTTCSLCVACLLLLVQSSPLPCTSSPFCCATRLVSAISSSLQRLLLRPLTPCRI